MESQNMGQIQKDIGEIKTAMGKMVELMTEVSLHNKRLEYLEAQAMDSILDRKDIWKHYREMHEGCLMKDAVYQDAKVFLAGDVRKWWQESAALSTKPKSPDEWFTLFLGGGLRNGVWIAISNLITVLIMRHFGG